MTDMNYLSRRAEGFFLIMKQCELPDHSVDMKEFYKRRERYCDDHEDYANDRFELEYRGMIRVECEEDGVRIFITKPWHCPRGGYPQQEPKGFEVEEV